MYKRQDYSISVDNPKCKAFIIGAEIKVYCPKGEQTRLIVTSGVTMDVSVFIDREMVMNHIFYLGDIQSAGGKVCGYQDLATTVTEVIQ